MVTEKDKELFNKIMQQIKINTKKNQKENAETKPIVKSYK
jgi:hypothetical protein|tara:strand:+ start:1039 stop:1158 length:120 start_codon:yes stop_codon:yes gene_type:complete